MLNSIACRHADFSLPWYKDRESELKIREIYRSHSAAQVEFVNRKFWEWCVIMQALQERSKLIEGSVGLGFAVGTEPLSSLFAAKGCRVLATDLDVESSEQGWIATNEHAASKNALYYPQLVAREMFDDRVSFQPADMRTLNGLSGSYDFIWSSCALEHLGTLQAGMD
ncbi:MAG TPA: class I SAM-dependent methyltransferase, partial [Dyella sp.]|uniref:SAM-dependent methyltransferase n=1 Tax=Dyella sp. TaxID=1869338 RepID=UPI002F93A83E